MIKIKLLLIYILVREINFAVEYRDQTEHITMLDNETIRMYFVY